jgi:threonine dehydrogenase-like Zn-dependent dehydrogenase
MLNEPSCADHHQNYRSAMHLLFSPTLASVLVIGGGSVGLLIVIIVVVLLLRRK